ncbi:MAG TPA: 30S ribosomal protein S19e [Candidatus Korarchaeota archaeon]|nr:30S ribosomal protein S19e [Candidatus Korarchaeota archaeon]
MPTARDVRADLLINSLKEELKKFESIKPPEWAFYTKTGAHKERPPMQDDWWYIRAASILRTLYMRGGRPVGVERLRTKYGGRKDRGVRPERFIKGSGHVIRLILQQLEDAGLVEKVERKGRKITPKGVSLLDRIAASLIKEMELTPGRVEVP